MLPRAAALPAIGSCERTTRSRRLGFRGIQTTLSPARRASFLAAVTFIPTKFGIVAATASGRSGEALIGGAAGSTGAASARPKVVVVVLVVLEEVVVVLEEVVVVLEGVVVARGKSADAAPPRTPIADPAVRPRSTVTPTIRRRPTTQM